jgi:hypothetical protein
MPSGATMVGTARCVRHNGGEQSFVEVSSAIRQRRAAVRRCLRRNSLTHEGVANLGWVDALCVLVALTLFRVAHYRGRTSA